MTAAKAPTVAEDEGAARVKARERRIRELLRDYGANDLAYLIADIEDQGERHDALAASRAEGRREGLEEAVAVCERKSTIERNGPALGQRFADAIRSLIIATKDPKP